MKQKVRFTSVLLMIVLVIAVISVSTGRKRDYLTYSNATDEVAAVVDGNELTLKDMAFYVVYEEQLVERDAFIYDPENTGRYWNLHTNGVYVRIEAKATAMDMAIHDAIFYEMAMKEGVELNQEEEQYLSNTQSDFWSDLKEGIIEQLGVSEEVLNESMRKIALAEKYQSLLAVMNEVEYEEYSFSGEAYEKLLLEHEYEVKEDVWERVHFGSITVAH